VQVGDDAAVVDQVMALYSRLQEQGITVLLDDRDERPGTKFADAELLGMPHRVTVSPRSLEHGGVEYTNRRTGESNILTADELLAKLA
jgi:prolyl-tRNA synthetase